MARIELKMCRIRKGLYQKEIAKVVGLTVSSFSQIELGHRPTTGKTAKRIADYLDKPFDELFTVSIKGGQECS